MLLALLFTAALAQDATPACAESDSIVALVQSQTLSLSTARRTRLPYGRDITLLVRAPDGTKAVTIQYNITGGRDGPRQGSVTAASVGDKSCWSAAIPPLHLNEIVTLAIHRLREPKFNASGSRNKLVADVTLALANLPYPLERDELRPAAEQALTAAVAANFDTPLDELVIQGTSDSTTLVQYLAALASNNLNVASALGDIQRFAQQLTRNLEGVDSTLFGPQPNCPFARGLTALKDSAAALVAAQPEQLLAEGRLPWPSCVRRWVEADSARFSERQRRTILPAVAYLTGGETLASLVDIARKVRAVSRIVVSTETFRVPIGADLLERYTQTDLVTAYLPGTGMSQAFATVTLYAFSPNRSDLTASIKPSRLGERLALQVGYPVGNPIADADTTFEPSAFVAMMYRINGMLSLSLGLVVGKSDPGASCRPFEQRRPSTCHLALSTNFDVSNLGIFQQLFARKDR